MSLSDEIRRYASSARRLAAKVLTGTESKEPKIEFFTAMAGLDAVHPPRPAGHILPEWFTKLGAVIDGRKAYDVNDDSARRTVRACPGIADLMGLGYIIPLWTDYALDLTADGEEFTWQVPREEFTLKVH